ncbi:flagellar basal body rod protein [Pandoraea apista]|nr:flagellar basal body rod protein [Pandoraea apista]RRW98067.1 flagellar basal body rod protein [Pandoraea apista]
MKKGAKVMWVAVTAAVLAICAAGGAWAYLSRKTATAAPVDKYKYVGIERIVVMLRESSTNSTAGTSSSGDASHYVVLSLALKSSDAGAPAIREQALLLRSLTVDALSGYTLEQIRQMNFADITAMINRTFTKSYTSRHVKKPFETAMISQLLVE